MKDLLNSLKQVLTNRITSSFYGTFIISWCLWNWKILYITFFIDSELLFNSKNVLKNEYISSFYPFDLWLPLLSTISKFILLPIFSTYVLICFLPMLVNFLFINKDLKFEKERRLARLDMEESLETKKGKVLEKEKENVQVEEEIKETKSDKWEKEYLDFKKTSYFKKFDRLYNLIYSYKGDLRGYSISDEILAYSETNGLIQFEDIRSVVLFTNKGLYFMKRYLDDLQFIK